MKKHAKSIVVLIFISIITLVFYRWDPWGLRIAKNLDNVDKIKQVQRYKLSGRLTPETIVIYEKKSNEDYMLPTKEVVILSFDWMSLRWRNIYEQKWDGEINTQVNTIGDDKKKAILISFQSSGSIGTLNYEVVMVNDGKVIKLLDGNDVNDVKFEHNLVTEKIDSGLVSMYKYESGKFINITPKANYTIPIANTDIVVTYSSSEGIINISKTNLNAKVGSTIIFQRSGQGPRIDIMGTGGDNYKFLEGGDKIKITGPGTFELQIMLFPKLWETAKVVRINAQ